MDITLHRCLLLMRTSLLCRIMRKVPDTIEGFEPLAAQLLGDRHHGVLLTGVTLMLEVGAAASCAVHPRHANKCKLDRIRLYG